MQSPIVVFDHIKKTVTMSPQGPVQDRAVEDVLAGLRQQVTSASGVAPAK